MLFILTGPIHSGKTTLLKKVVKELKDQQHRIDGFLSEVVIKNCEIFGYDLFDLREKRSIPFLRKKGEEGWENIGSYFFMPQSLEKANNIILRSKEDDLLIVDEVGPLELEGKGLWPVLKKVIFLPFKRSLLVMRLDVVKDFLRLAKNRELKIFDVREEKVFSSLLDEIKASH